MYQDIESVLSSAAEDINEILNKEFKENQAPVIIKALGGTQDQIAMNEEFNDWIDSLCKDGTIPDFAYNQACLEDYDDSEWRGILEAALKP